MTVGGGAGAVGGASRAFRWGGGNKVGGHARLQPRTRHGPGSRRAPESWAAAVDNTVTGR